MPQDFVVAQAYWGSTFAPSRFRFDPAVGSFSWIDMNAAIRRVCASHYLDELAQYGAGRVVDGGPLIDFNGTEPPSAWRQGTKELGFANDDIAAFLTEEIDAGRLASPTEWDSSEVPIYLVVLPRGLYSKDEFNAAVGIHLHFNYKGTEAIYCWVMQGDSLNDTTKIVFHEIVEAIGQKLGTKELCDDCTDMTGIVAGVTVQGYLALKDGAEACVIPGELKPWQDLNSHTHITKAQSRAGLIDQEIHIPGH